MNKIKKQRAVVRETKKNLSPITKGTDSDMAVRRQKAKLERMKGRKKAKRIMVGKPIKKKGRK